LIKIYHITQKSKWLDSTGCHWSKQVN